MMNNNQNTSTNKKKKIKIHNGDIIKGQFSFFLDGHEQIPYTKELELKVGNRSYINRLDDFLINRNFHSNMEVQFIFPKNCPNPDWANKKALIKITDAQIIKQKEINQHLEESTKEKDSQIELLSAENEILKLKIKNLEVEIQKTAQTYLDKAKELTAKAQEEISKSKLANNESLKNEINAAKAYALQSFAEDFLTPYNNFKLATRAGENSSDSSVQNYVYGFKMIEKQFNDVLNQHGLEIIEGQVGDEYDPEQHYAIDIVYDQNKNDNEIKQNKAFGLKLNGRVVKPATVVIYKKN